MFRSNPLICFNSLRRQRVKKATVEQKQLKREVQLRKMPNYYTVDKFPIEFNDKWFT